MLKLPCVCLCVTRAPQATILANLKDPDVSIRRRALDLLFTMCDGGAAVEVVEELVRGLDMLGAQVELGLLPGLTAPRFPTHSRCTAPHE